MNKTIFIAIILVTLGTYYFNKFKCELMNMDYKYFLCIARDKK